MRCRRGLQNSASSTSHTLTPGSCVRFLPFFEYLKRTNLRFQGILAIIKNYKLNCSQLASLVSPHPHAECITTRQFSKRHPSRTSNTSLTSHRTHRRKCTVSYRAPHSSQDSCCCCIKDTHGQRDSISETHPCCSKGCGG